MGVAGSNPVAPTIIIQGLCNKSITPCFVMVKQIGNYLVHRDKRVYLYQSYLRLSLRHGVEPQSRKIMGDYLNEF